MDADGCFDCDFPESHCFGLGAPLGGILIDRLGPKRIMLLGLSLNTFGLICLYFMNALWQFQIAWGIIVGIGTGLVTNVLGATVAMRWFNQHRGLVLGIFGAASAAVQTVFLPALLGIVSNYGWQAVIMTLAIVAAGALLPVFIFMRNQPQDIGLEPLGEVTAVGLQTDNRRTSLSEALKTRDFWQ